MPATVLNFPFQSRAVRIEAMTASHSLSVERNEYFGLGIDSSTPFCVVASHASQIVFISSAAGPGLRQGRSHVEREGRGGGGRAGELQKVPTGRAHAPSLVVRPVHRAAL